MSDRTAVIHDAICAEFMRWRDELPDKGENGWNHANGVLLNRRLTDAVEVALSRLPESRPHRCIGCSRQWDGHSPADICGDCWRELQRLRAESRPTPGSEFRDLRDAVVGIWPNPEDCDECAALSETGNDVPCRLCGPSANALYRAVRAADEVLGPCVCGHKASEHHDEDTTRCKVCGCLAFELPAAPASVGAGTPPQKPTPCRHTDFEYAELGGTAKCRKCGFVWNAHVAPVAAPVPPRGAEPQERPRCGRCNHTKTFHASQFGACSHSNGYSTTCECDGWVAAAAPLGATEPPASEGLVLAMQLRACAAANMDGYVEGQSHWTDLLRQAADALAALRVTPTSAEWTREDVEASITIFKTDGYQEGGRVVRMLRAYAATLPMDPTRPTR